MKAKPIIPRELANRDVDEAIDRYLEDSTSQAALGFIDALRRAYAHIARYPATGSPCYGPELDLPGLRSWPLARYPYLVFYVEHRNHVDVWRVLHGRRDIPEWLRESEET